MQFTDLENARQHFADAAHERDQALEDVENLTAEIERLRAKVTELSEEAFNYAEQLLDKDRDMDVLREERNEADDRLRRFTRIGPVALSDGEEGGGEG